MEKVFASLVLFFAFLVVGMPEPAAQAPIVLNAVTPWPKGWMTNDMFFEWVNLVNQRAEGRLKIEYKGGPEVFPPFEQLDPLKRGLVDVLLTSPAYVAGALPEVNATWFLFDSSDPAKVREIGLYERLDRITREKAGVGVLGATIWSPFAVFLNKPIDKANLRGFKLRSNPAYDPVLRTLGAATVTLPPPEIITALQTGTVDGFAWPSNFVVTPGYARFVKYKVTPWFWQAVEGVVFVNGKSFDGLPADMKRLVTETMKEIERKAKDYYLGKERAEDEELKKLGVQFITISAAEIAKVNRIQWEEGTKAFLTNPSPKYGPELKTLLAPFAPR